MRPRGRESAAAGGPCEKSNAKIAAIAGYGRVHRDKAISGDVHRDKAISGESHEGRRDRLDMAAGAGALGAASQPTRSAMAADFLQKQRTARATRSSGDRRRGHG
jgi:hypothetical protein